MKDNWEILAWKLFNAGEKLANTMDLLVKLFPLENTGLEEMREAIKDFKNRDS